MPIDLTAATQTARPYFRDKSSDNHRRHFTWIGPASYSAGGEVIDPHAVFGFGRIVTWHPMIASNGTLFLISRYSVTAGKLQWIKLADGAEASGDLSAYVAYGEVIGR